MSKFGWSYPPGAENDPYAPYNQEPELDNSHMREAFPDYVGPYHLYRMIYKGTDCGASVGALIEFTREPEPYLDDSGPAGGGYSFQDRQWFYCDDLKQWGSWTEMDQAGAVVHALCVSSIVEGVEETTERLEVSCNWDDDSPEDIHKRFWAAVDEIEAQAREIWCRTHGCEACLEHWGGGCDEYGNEFEIGDCPIWDECPECKGDGIVI